LPFDSYRSWLDGILGPRGYVSHLVGTYDRVALVVFDRST